MFRGMIALGLVMLVALVLVSSSFNRGSAAPPATADADFEGKIVCVTIKDGDNRIVEKARVKRLGERAFIVGTAVKFIDDAPEMTYWLPLDEVHGLAIFNSVDDVKKNAMLLAQSKTE